MPRNTKKEWRGIDVISTGEALPLYDCAVAPCQTACAIHQDVPEYLRLVGQGRYAEALDVIYNKNPLPFITGWICDHKCQYNCTRLDYEGSVKIRDMKKIAAQQGWREYIEAFSSPSSGHGCKCCGYRSRPRRSGGCLFSPPRRSTGHGL